MYYLEPAVVALAAVGSAAVGVVAVGSVVDVVLVIAGNEYVISSCCIRNRHRVAYIIISIL